MAAPLGGGRDAAAVAADKVVIDLAAAGGGAAPVSAYNAAYTCRIVALELQRNALVLTIVERGDGSLGPIQPPEVSSLRVVAAPKKAGGGGGGASRSLSLRDSEWDVRNDNAAEG